MKINNIKKKGNLSDDCDELEIENHFTRNFVISLNEAGFINVTVRIYVNLPEIIIKMSLSNKVKKLSNSSGDSVYVCTYESPVGKVITAADDDFLYIVTFEDTRNYEISFELLAQELSCKFIEAENKVLQSFKEQLSDYFSGKLKKFTVPIKTFGSNFQKVFFYIYLNFKQKYQFQVSHLIFTISGHKLINFSTNKPEIIEYFNLHGCN